METTFYCVMAQFFEYGKTLAAITHSRKVIERPKDQRQTKPGQTAFKIWLRSKVTALEWVKLIRNGSASVDDLVNLMSAHNIDALLGRRAA